MWKKICNNPIPLAIVILGILCVAGVFLFNSQPATASDDDVISGEVRTTEQHAETFEEFVENHEVDTSKPPLVGKTDDGGMFILVWEGTKHTVSEAFDLAGEKLSQFIDAYNENLGNQSSSSAVAVSDDDGGGLEGNEQDLLKGEQEKI